MTDKVDVLGEFHQLALRAARTSGKKWPKVPGINFRFSYFPLKIKSNFQAGQKHGLNLFFSWYTNDNDEDYDNFEEKGEW